jgi:hypothetical protein
MPCVKQKDRMSENPDIRSGRHDVRSFRSSLSKVPGLKTDEFGARGRIHQLRGLSPGRKKNL